MARVAILLSHYNGDKYVKEQIDSILGQQISNDISLSLFVRDDGSTNSDLSILKYYEQQKQLTLFAEKNVGVKLSFYKLMEKIEGFDYYFFSDQDDVWLENKVQSMVNRLQKFENINQFPVGVFSDLLIADKYAQSTGKLMKHSDFCLMSENKNFARENILKYYMVTGASFAFNEAARCSAVKMGSGIFKNTNMHDSTMAFMIVLSGTLLYLDKPLVLYRQHENNVIGYHEQNSILKKIQTLQRVFDGKLCKLFDVYIISKKIENISDKRIQIINSIFTRSKFNSIYYSWKLKKDIFGPKKMVSWVLFLFFGIRSVNKYQSKLAEVKKL
ncbi:glycosyltransferase [Leuconostoc mesenteroides]|uniref:glycosyltransferase n=1 Tax=Leuconostoc mesenteroides TaxID=1245 RepID=UPI00248CB865|nr:glycosyltransferase [Leuconostoc mesenteroides]